MSPADHRGLSHLERSFSGGTGSSGTKCQRAGAPQVYFHHEIEKKTKSVAAKEVIEAVLLIWGGPDPDLRSPNHQGEAPQPGGQVRVPPKTSETGIRDRPDERENVQGDVEDLSDVGSSDALDQMTVEEDKAFLRNQREDRATSSMAGLDCVTVEAQERKEGEGAGRKDEEGALRRRRRKP
ncbi:hypothetical protein GWK47_041333 [Chionoecetes opilio]|uniref:Uncharacterized protein n=1 Tax=Chionoecetes opilio TaxID=41210 RepID=A0A8J4Y9X7_CHIOP|nr:hypothetical protein GWK47_041333 [Chionoecetes opilio]